MERLYKSEILNSGLYDKESILIPMKNNEKSKKKAAIEHST